MSEPELNDIWASEVVRLRDERDRLRANLINCSERLAAYYGDNYPAVVDARAALTPAGQRWTRHSLKCWPAFFQAIIDGTKTFEIRLNDRGYQDGDVLELSEYDHIRGEFTGRQIKKRVTFITDWEQKPGYIVMALGPITPNEATE